MEGTTTLKILKGGVLVGVLRAIKMMKKFKRFVSVLIVILICTTLIQMPVSGATAPTLEVLEVQPGLQFDLTTISEHLVPGYTINLTQMSMPEFISKVDEINGKYDIVYIGNNTSGGSYTALGQAPTYLPQGGTNGNTPSEFYSGNDITNRRAATLKDFIDSNQFTIFDKSIIVAGSSLKDTKLYSNFRKYLVDNNRDSTAHPNFNTIDFTNGNKNTKLSNEFATYNNSGVKRPSLTLTSQPKKYDGTDASYQTGTNKLLGFSFDIDNQTTGTNMTIKLFVDSNGDGIFKDSDDAAGPSEQVYEMDNKDSGTGYTLNYHLPDSVVGLEPWKLELSDNTTGAKTYLTGATAFKATDIKDVLNVRLLQLIPDGNTMSIYSLGPSLLKKDMVYNIQVTEMKVADFNAAYVANPNNPGPVSAVVNGQTKKAPTILNGNYDMIIMGFADMYGNDDLNLKAIPALQSFINTDQSVMFTHDTLTFDVAKPGSWGYNITQYFRALVGQQRYYKSPNADQDPMPSTIKDSYGFSNLTLGRYNGSKLFQTTTKTHKVNDSLVTEFPFVLQDIQVAPTHFQYFQLDLEDENVVPVYTLSNDSNSSIYSSVGDGRNNYYTYTKGNITYSGTGHSVPNGLPEKEMFVNTMIKASRGANHAPTLEVNGISDGMNIANTLTSIDFNFTATDIDPGDQSLKASVYLATSRDGTNFGAYQQVKLSSTDQDLSRIVKSGVEQAVSIAKTADTSINAYKVKIVAADNNNAEVVKEITINSKNDPQIAVQSFSATCLTGDTVNVPVNLVATATVLKETFKDIKVKGEMTNPDTSSVEAYNGVFTDLTFSPNSSWLNNVQTSSYPLTFKNEGTYSIENQLTYNAYNGVTNAELQGQQAQARGNNDQKFSIQVKSGMIDVEVLDAKGKGITGVPVTVSTSSNHGSPLKGTTNSSGMYTIAGLSSGSYTVTVSVPDGRTIQNTSQTVDLSASASHPTLTFKMGGGLISNPSITTPTGDSKISILKNIPIQAQLGFTLNREADSINLNLINSLNSSSNSTNLHINGVYCDGQPFANYKIASSNPLIISPSQSNTHFPSGNYSLDVTITIAGVTMRAPETFTVSLTNQTSAKDANTGSTETIASAPTPLTVQVVTSPRLH